MKFSLDCRNCQRLSGYLDQVRRDHPDYHARPVAPFGDARPRLLIVGLAPGRLAAKKSEFGFRHGARHEISCGLTLYDSYHCSRYNTQTKRLTESMFNQVFSDIVKNLSKIRTNPPA